MLDMVEELLQKGIKLHKLGKVEVASQTYTAILKVQPEHPDANHNMGVLAVGLGKIKEALPFFETALEANADTLQFWLSYIDALIKLERMADAQAVFDQAKNNGAEGTGFDQLEQRLNVPNQAQLETSSKALKAHLGQPNILDTLKLDQAVRLAKKKSQAGSTKEAICKSVENHPRRRNFLACHPIAGTENSGPSSAITNLYKGKTNIICEIEKTTFKLQEKALEIFRKLGMRIRYMDSKSHDKHIAYVSHLSHISSFMLGKTVIEKEKNECDIFDMAGSGFTSTVRLAKSSPAMWTPIFEQNKENVIVFYMTSGSIIKEISKNKLFHRDQESLYVLKKFGVKNKNIIFFGRTNNIPTCRLYRKMDIAIFSF